MDLVLSNESFLEEHLMQCAVKLVIFDGCAGGTKVNVHTVYSGEILMLFYRKEFLMLITGVFNIGYFETIYL